MEAGTVNNNVFTYETNTQHMKNDDEGARTDGIRL